MNKIEHQHLDLIVKDCLMNIGYPDDNSVINIKNTGDTRNYPHKKIMPGSSTFADLYHHNFKKIDELPDLEAQMKFIKENESFQWPIWLLPEKNHYMEVLENEQ